MQIQQRLLNLTFALFFLLFCGTVAYRAVEGDHWTMLDGLFMTVITLFTVGYSEVHTLSSSGRMLTIILILLGGGFMAYAASTIAQMLFEGKIREIWGHKKMRKQINDLKNHYIVCGAGKTAQEIIKSLKGNAPNQFVVIDIDHARVEKLLEENIFAIEGDATSDEVLIEAGIERAAGVAVTLPTDADNVFVTLSARGFKSDLFVVAKAEKIDSIAKLRKAGANKVVSPNIIAGARMASMLYRPTVMDFMDAALAGDNNAMKMEEFRIQSKSYLDGKAIKDAEIRQRSGAIIVSVRRESETIVNPLPTLVFKAFDILVVLGTSEQISNFSPLTKVK
ncbi:MAG: potassium channel protein [Candidatus Riflebacteria bacterium HGW-Riflebacteria-2]|jgi:voltage-gated potassium channel|nr:MAG: potassium channel protein [Candidatus Riflebacteria bacterium HGW-Riflebacteria-2]